MFTDDPSVIGKARTTANTSVVWHAGRLLALKEASPPVEIEPHTLATLGNYDFAGKLTSEAFTAHPKIDPRTGEMVAYGYFTKTVADNIIEIFYVDRQGRLTRTELFEAPYPSMVHDCLLSEHYVIFAICPMICDWERVKKGEPFFHWDDRRPTLVAVVPREERGTSRVRWFRAPKSVMQTHSFNAWEEGKHLHLEHFVTDTGWLSQFPDINNPAAAEKPPFAYRWTLDLESTSDSFESVRLFPHIGEMPMIDLRFLTRKTRHFWFGTSNTALGPMLPRGPKGPPFTCLGHFDAVTEKIDYWYAGAHSSPEEPVFVPRNPNAEEGDGWLMTMVGRRAENRTDFVILDARNLSAGPGGDDQISVPCCTRDFTASGYPTPRPHREEDRMAPAHNGYALLVARLCMASLFLWSGVEKALDLRGAAQFAASRGIPFALQLMPLAILLEVGCGLMLVTGVASSMGGTRSGCVDGGARALVSSFLAGASGTLANDDR